VKIVDSVDIPGDPRQRDRKHLVRVEVQFYVSIPDAVLQQESTKYIDAVGVVRKYIEEIKSRNLSLGMLFRKLDRFVVGGATVRASF
jgi:hypothetical protein